MEVTEIFGWIYDQASEIIVSSENRFLKPPYQIWKSLSGAGTTLRSSDGCQVFLFYLYFFSNNTVCCGTPVPICSFTIINFILYWWCRGQLVGVGLQRGVREAVHGLTDWKHPHSAISNHQCGVRVPFLLDAARFMWSHKLPWQAGPATSHNGRQGGQTLSSPLMEDNNRQLPRF